MSELTKYRKMYKDNQAEIKRLVAVNKHVAEHIKFLEAQEPDSAEDKGPGLPLRDFDGEPRE